jgi:hypothetical protein
MANLIKAATPTRGLVVVVAFVVVLALGAGFIYSKKEGRTVDLTENNVVTEATTPPIAVSVPSETATATFALG